MQQVAPLEIGIPVIDLGRMVAFYHDVLGCEEVRRADIPAALTQKISVSHDGYTNVWLKFPGGEVLKLVSPPSPPKRRDRPRYLSTHTGIAYMTLYCSDLKRTMAKAEECGAILISDRALTEQEGLKLAFLEDPEGNVFELVQSE